jgi:CRISPR-associated protein Csm1
MFFTVAKKADGTAFPLPGGSVVSACTKRELDEKLSGDNAAFVRFYGKNAFYVGKDLATKLWVGDYCKEKDILKYAKHYSEGIERIGVLRMDVDNLGQAFTSGFAYDGGKYNTLSRTAVFSRHLSLFFKRDLNILLRESKRASTIIYSGGDDLFLLGAWDGIVETALEINDAFRKYTQGKLTLSAGIGLFTPKYPVRAMARETGELEDCAKRYKRENTEKNAVCLFTPELCLGWDELENKVIKEKLAALKSYFDGNTEKGGSFLYKLLTYLYGIETEEKDKKAKISLARYAYMLSRIEPNTGNDDEKLKFKEFSRSMYDWMTDKDERKQLKAAIYLYIYSKRGDRDDDGNQW